VLSLEEARDRAVIMLAQFAAGQDPKEEKRKAATRDLTLRAAMARFLSSRELSKSAKKWPRSFDLHLGDWQDRLAPPKVVLDKTNEYLNEQDDIAQFIQERCVVPEPELPVVERQRAQIHAREMYEEWRLWCQASGIYPGRLSDFIDRIRARGFAHRKPGNVDMFYGITIQYGEGMNDVRVR